MSNLKQSLHLLLVHSCSVPVLVPLLLLLLLVLRLSVFYMIRLFLKKLMMWLACVNPVMTRIPQCSIGQKSVALCKSSVCWWYSASRSLKKSASLMIVWTSCSIRSSWVSMNDQWCSAPILGIWLSTSFFSFWNSSSSSPSSSSSTHKWNIIGDFIVALEARTQRSTIASSECMEWTKLPLVAVSSCETGLGFLFRVRSLSCSRRLARLRASVARSRRCSSRVSMGFSISVM
mmetsp:Transcript_16763/g.34528  ORF Transcript_16763/g.34528 Transcript_16763/m.34528 type:complete len:232 (+) Transcript_16763:930-1625(+)